MKGRNFFDFRFLLVSFLLLLVVMFVLPFFSAESYSILKNTTSELGAQNTPNAWIMNVTFILVGASSILEAWLHLHKFWFHKILLSVFGLSLIFVGIFHHAPIAEGVMFDVQQDNLHSIFASIVGLSFTIFAIASAFIETEGKHRVIDIVVGVTATLLSLLMLLLPDYAGIWQRVMFILSFSWLITMLERIRVFNKMKNGSSAPSNHIERNHTI